MLRGGRCLGCNLCLSKKKRKREKVKVYNKISSVETDGSTDCVNTQHGAGPASAECAAVIYLLHFTSIQPRKEKSLPPLYCKINALRRNKWRLLRAALRIPLMFRSAFSDHAAEDSQQPLRKGLQGLRPGGLVSVCTQATRPRFGVFPTRPRTACQRAFAQHFCRLLCGRQVPDGWSHVMTGHNGVARSSEIAGCCLKVNRPYFSFLFRFFCH